MGFLNLSTESEAPAGYFIMKILNPIEIEFNKLHQAAEYGSKIDNIGVIPICTSKRMIENGFYKERRYISWRNRYIDYRLRLDYELFLAVNPNTRIEMCIRNVINSFMAISIRTKGTVDMQKLSTDFVRIANRIYKEDFFKLLQHEIDYDD